MVDGREPILYQPSTFNSLHPKRDVHAEFGQRLGHAQLLLQVHGEAGRLLAVAQRGVEDDELVGHGVALDVWVAIRAAA